MTAGLLLLYIALAAFVVRWVSVRMRGFRKASQLFAWMLNESLLPAPERSRNLARSVAKLDGRETVLTLRPFGNERQVQLEIACASDGDGPRFAALRAGGTVDEANHGDAELNARVVLLASDAFVWCCLHGDLRADLLALLAEGWNLRLDAGPPQRLLATRDGLPADLLPAARRVRALAGAALPEDVPAALAERIRTEPRTSIRVACLVALTEQIPFRAPTRQALQEARNDRDEPLRCVALRALSQLGEALTHDEARVLLRSGQERDRLAGVHALRSDQPLPEAELLACLRSGEELLVLEAARPLVERGSRLSLAELGRAAQRRDLPSAARRALTAAHAALRDRLGGHDLAGGLTLIEDRSARLALADPSPAGGVALIGEVDVAAPAAESAPAPDSPAEAPAKTPTKTPAPEAEAATEASATDADADAAPARPKGRNPA